MNFLICSLAILVNFAPRYHSHVNTFGTAGAVIDRFQGNLFDQFVNPLSEFFELIPGLDFKKIVVAGCKGCVTVCCAAMESCASNV